MSSKLQKHRRKLIFAGIVLLIVSLLYGFRYFILMGIGNYLVIQDELRKADLIAVMPGDWQQAEYAIELYKKGYAPKIFFIGDAPEELAISNSENFQVITKPWKEVAKGIALAHEISEKDLLLAGEQTDSTYKQVEQFVNTAQTHGFHSIIVVSDPVHLRRISWCVGRLIHDEGLDLIYAPIPQAYYPPESRFDPKNWWKHENSLKALFDEYVKLGFYLFNYR